MAKKNNISLTQENQPTTNGLDIAPVKRKQSLAGQICDVLLERITTGSLRPGDQLPTEQQLSAAFKVSRSVIREAIARLKQTGNIETQQGRGAFVVEQKTTIDILASSLQPSISPANIMELRRIIEPEIAGLAAIRRNESDIEALEKEIAIMKNAGNILHERTQADMRFHTAIATASKNPLFASVIENLYPLFTQFLYLAHDNASKVKGTFIAAEGEHDAIVKAIIESDSSAAMKAMKKHLQRSSIRLSIF